MDEEIDYQNNPLHGVGLKTVLNELVDHYGYEILYAYLNINCFKMNPSIESSIKFLKKTDWAREKVESFYLYQFKNLPRASDDQFVLAPRDRIIPTHQKPGQPAELSIEEGERLTEKRARKNPNMGRAQKQRSNGVRSGSRGEAEVDQSQRAEEQDLENPAGKPKVDPWAKARDRLKR